MIYKFEHFYINQKKIMINLITDDMKMNISRTHDTTDTFVEI